MPVGHALILHRYRRGDPNARAWPADTAGLKLLEQISPLFLQLAQIGQRPGLPRRSILRHESENLSGRIAPDQHHTLDDFSLGLDDIACEFLFLRTCLAGGVKRQ